MKTVLVVDDHANVRSLVKDYLSQEGYRVVTAENGQHALFVARQEKPDLILLDIMMPVMDGLEFLRIFSKESDTPVIFLTARVEEVDLVLGLEMGADDYITKPFSMRELLARVRVAIRRAGKGAPQGEVLRAGELLLDRVSHQVRLAGEEVRLTPSEFDLLELLMSNQGRAFSRSSILEHLQGVAFEGIERTIDVHIRNLRTKIEPDPSEPRYIETVFGVGYRFASQPPKFGQSGAVK